MSSPESPSAESPPPGASLRAAAGGGSPFELNANLLHFDPAWFDSYQQLVASLYRAGVGAVAELGAGRPSPLAEHAKQFGVAWVALGPASPPALRRLAVGCRRFRLAIASADMSELRRQLGSHPLFRSLPAVELRPSADLLQH